jgi:hypothetical protein
MDDPYRGTSLETDYQPQLAPAGRVCRADNCTTLLSVYNSAKFCSLHARSKVQLSHENIIRKTKVNWLLEPERPANAPTKAKKRGA